MLYAAVNKGHMKRLIALLVLLLILLTSCAQQASKIISRDEALFSDVTAYPENTETLIPSDAPKEPVSPDEEAAEPPAPTAEPTPAPTAETTPAPTAEPTPTPAKSAKVKSHFINVGQGDSIFIELPEGRCMLIDSGEREYGDLVINYIKKLGYKKINYLVVTHAHSDHMGSMSQVVDSFKIGKVYMPKAGNNTASYEKLLESIQNKNLKIKTAKAGVSILKEENLSIEIIAPTKDYDDLNNTSAVVLLTFGKTKFLYMGDAERLSENDITANVKCNVVKVGHHGSSTSSSYEFIARTHAKYAVISVAKENDYGHPKNFIIRRWKKSGAAVLRTDELGSIVITSNGKKITVKAEKSDTVPSPQSSQDNPVLVLNSKTKKVHIKSCEHVKSIQPEYYYETTKNVYFWIEQGYTPCGGCHPEE